MSDNYSYGTPWTNLVNAWLASAAKHEEWSKEPDQYLDFYWGVGENFELNDYLDDSLLTTLAKAYCESVGVIEGHSGYVRQDGYVFWEDADGD